MRVRSTKYIARGSNSRGQALVLVLLSLAVVLTIVLFVLARSVTDVAVSSRSEDAVRAFSAAEAGVERALVGIDIHGSNSVGDATYTGTVTGFAAGDTTYNYPLVMSSGDSMITWFVSHDASGNTECTDGLCFTGTSMTVCWGNSGTLSAVTPAIEVSVFYKNTPAQADFSSLRIGRLTADPYYSVRQGTNHFAAPTNTGACPGVTYAFKTTFTFASVGVTSAGTPNGLQFARVRMLYNSTPQPLGVTVAGGTNLPSQGLNIASTGTAGDSNRKVAVFQGWPEPPSVFDYAVYSGSATGLTK